MIKHGVNKLPIYIITLSIPPLTGAPVTPPWCVALLGNCLSSEQFCIQTNVIKLLLDLYGETRQKLQEKLFRILVTKNVLYVLKACKAKRLYDHIS